MKTRWLALTVLGSGIYCMMAAAADWPQWRGPNRDGNSQEKGLLQEWPKEGPKLLWQVEDIGDGYATPAVVGTHLYLLSSRGLDDEYVQSLNVADGKQAWHTRIGKVGKPDQKPPFPMARSTPDGGWRVALCARVGWRSSLPGNGWRQRALEEESANRFRRQARPVGVRRIAAR